MNPPTRGFKHGYYDGTLSIEFVGGGKYAHQLEEELESYRNFLDKNRGRLNGKLISTIHGEMYNILRKLGRI